MSSWAELFADDADVPPLVDGREARRVVWLDMDPPPYANNYRGGAGDDLYVDPPEPYFDASLVFRGSRFTSVVQLEMGTKTDIPGHKPVRLRREIERTDLDDIIRKLQVLRAAMDVVSEFAIDKNVKLYNEKVKSDATEKEDKAGPQTTGEKFYARPPPPT